MAQHFIHFKDLASAGQNRIAIVTPCGAVYAKDDIGLGSWIDRGAQVLSLAG
ncbi:hypothetical protein [Amycolatopsis sp. cg9]|uniref:hypothetical protein n=1 Tax=Amycolatopsis sp. cg9 TaxID=3238801 RepID=UPI0035254223